MLCHSVDNKHSTQSNFRTHCDPPVKQFAHPWIRRTLNLGLMV